jgi:hypothetical protein
MRLLARASALTLGLAFALIGSTAVAQDLDGGATPAAGAPSKSSKVREVARGFYVKANAGTLLFVGPRGGAGFLEPGTSVALTVGQDFIDKEKSSAAWEIFFHQSLNNGAKYFVQGGQPPSLLIQGDIHTFTGGAAVEYSTYLTRRLGLGGRAGGGLSMVPLLMDKQEYLATVVNDTWGGQQPAVHNGPVPVAFAGPTIEYYTKLSHFSVGIDASFAFYVGLDFGIDATGYLKYTF